MVEAIREGKMAAKKNALKKIVANMTMGNDMGPLFTEVVNCVSTGSIEVKKMVYLYLIHYARHKPDLANIAVANMILVHSNSIVNKMTGIMLMSSS